MSICIERVVSQSPFKVLREQAGLSLEDMAGAIYVKADTLNALETDDWEAVTVGLPLWSDLMARVGVVAAGRYQFPTAKASDLTDMWHAGMLEIGNAFNQSSWQ